MCTLTMEYGCKNTLYYLVHGTGKLKGKSEKLKVEEVSNKN